MRAKEEEEEEKKHETVHSQVPTQHFVVSLWLLRFPYFPHFHKRTMSIVGEAVKLKHGFKSFQVTWSPKNNWKFKCSKMQYIVVMNQLIV